MFLDNLRKPDRTTVTEEGHGDSENTQLFALIN